jgi:hypothetical protein
MSRGVLHGTPRSSMLRHVRVGTQGGPSHQPLLQGLEAHRSRRSRTTLEGRTLEHWHQSCREAAEMLPEIAWRSERRDASVRQRIPKPTTKNTPSDTESGHRIPLFQRAEGSYASIVRLDEEGDTAEVVQVALRDEGAHLAKGGHAVLEGLGQALHQLDHTGFIEGLAIVRRHADEHSL